jgi:hypothetical protein
MSNDSLAAPSRVTVHLAHYFGDISDSLEWNSSAWVELEERLAATTRPLDSLTIGEIMQALAETRCGSSPAAGNFVKRMIGQHDLSRHDLFRVIRKLFRIYDLRIIELLELIDVLERCPGTVEDMSIKNLLALIAIVDIEEEPLAAIEPDTDLLPTIH